MARKTIAITLNSLWNIYNFRIPLIQDLQRAGYKVIVFAPQDTDIKKIRQLDIPYVSINSLSRDGRNPLQDLALVRELKQLYKENSIDAAVHFTIKPNIYGSIAASQLGIPSLAVVTGLGYTFLSSGLASRVAKRLYKFAFRRNSLTIFQNRDDRQLFIDKKLVHPEWSRVILGSGIDMKKFKNDRPIYERNNKVLFVGRLLYDKGVRELLEGFEMVRKRLPMVSLHLVGGVDKNNPASLHEEDLSKWQNDQMKFWGFQDDVKSFIQDADVVILPSYREGLPRTMLEALAMGKPVITTDVAGCREVVRDGENGYLVPSHNAEAVGKAIFDFYQKTSEQWKNMGAKSLKMATEKFSCEIINRQYINEIERILNK